MPYVKNIVCIEWNTMFVTKRLQDQNQFVGLAQFRQQRMFQIMHAFVGGIDVHGRAKLNRKQQLFSS